MEVLKRKPTKSIWIMAHVKLSKTYLFGKTKIEKQTKIATHMDLWKYDQILTVKWLKFSKKRFFIWVYHLVLHNIVTKKRGRREIWRKHSSNQTSPIGLALTKRAQRNHTAKDQHDLGKRDFRDKTPWLILHRMSSTSQALLLDKFTKLQTFQSSSSLSLTLQISAAMTWLELPGATEKVRRSAKITQLQIFHHCYVHQNSAFLSSTDPSISSKLSS